ncbi:MAG: DUF5522 domain-containing protein [Bacteroidia bacterium]
MEEGIDYYINDKGQYVFTEIYLHKRGHCCLLNCVHCPYGHNKKAVPYFAQDHPAKITKSNNRQ